MKKIMFVGVFLTVSALSFCGCVVTESAGTSVIAESESRYVLDNYEELSVESGLNSSETVIVESDFPTYSDIGNLAGDSILVVMGQYVDEVPEIKNTAKNPNNPSIESNEVYAECRIFKFNVAEVIKGECSEDQIQVGLSYGIRPANVDVLAVKDTYLEPTTDDYKVLFLMYSEADQFYYPTSQPYQLHSEQSTSRSSNGEKVTFVLDTAIDELNIVFSDEVTLEEIKEKCDS